jgi:predicted metal-dependent hydrolase
VSPRPPRAPRAPGTVSVPGIPPGVEVRRSPRRRRTVTAYREGGRTVVLVPARMSVADILAYVHELVGRLDARDKRGPRSDADLMRRAQLLARRFLPEGVAPTSVRWVTNQRARWGSCTPLDGTIRLSHRLQPFPEYVVDYVLLHELAHLLVPGHGPDFELLLEPYPHLQKARGFLEGVSHAASLPPDVDLGPDLHQTDEAAPPAATGTDGQLF